MHLNFATIFEEFLLVVNFDFPISKLPKSAMKFERIFE